MIRYNIFIPPDLAFKMKKLHPELKKSVKSALRYLAENPDAGIPLEKELEGWMKYKVRRYRIIYKLNRKKKIIQIDDFGHREDIYNK